MYGMLTYMHTSAKLDFARIYYLFLLDLFKFCVSREILNILITMHKQKIFLIEKRTLIFLPLVLSSKLVDRRCQVQSSVALVDLSFGIFRGFLRNSHN